MPDEVAITIVVDFQMRTPQVVMSNVTLALTGVVKCLPVHPRPSDTPMKFMIGRRDRVGRKGFTA